MKTLLIGRDPDAGKYHGQKERDDNMRWHHLLKGYEFEETTRNSERQGGLFCCRTCNHKESDMAQQLNDTSKDTGTNEGSGPGWSRERFS